MEPHKFSARIPNFQEVLPLIELHNHGVYLVNGVPAPTADVPEQEARKATMAWRILQAHNISGDPKQLRIRFDAMVSHDITYVGIIQQARASGMKEFPIPYALTNCHNSLCAVGGTINEDDHMFGLSAAKKYGGIYVPANQSVIHSYAREELTRCGGMILGSDSHTRYGALGTMAVGEGGPELAKQLLKNTWDVPMPEVVLVYLTGKPSKGIGPHDVAIALVKATFESGFVKNRVLEFAGPGIASLPIDFRNGVDVMTTETTCLSSIWETDEITKGFYGAHGRAQDFCELHPGENAYYDRMITIDLDKVESHDRASVPSVQRLDHSRVPGACGGASGEGRGRRAETLPQGPCKAHRQAARRRRLGRSGHHCRMQRRPV